jgi:hypothetical protein
MTVQRQGKSAKFGQKLFVCSASVIIAKLCFADAFQNKIFARTAFATSHPLPVCSFTHASSLHLNHYNIPPLPTSLP